MSALANWMKARKRLASLSKREKTQRKCFSVRDVIAGGRGDPAGACRDRRDGTQLVRNGIVNVTD